MLRRRSFRFCCLQYLSHFKFPKQQNWIEGNDVLDARFVPPSEEEVDDEFNLKGEEGAYKADYKLSEYPAGISRAISYIPQKIIGGIISVFTSIFKFLINSA